MGGKEERREENAARRIKTSCNNNIVCIMIKTKKIKNPLETRNGRAALPCRVMSAFMRITHSTYYVTSASAFNYRNNIIIIIICAGKTTPCVPPHRSTITTRVSFDARPSI